MVFDTSSFVNGRRDHYMVPGFEPVWDFLAAAIVEGRVVLPRAVYTELRAKDDALAEWTSGLREHVVEPAEDVQHEAGRIRELFPPTVNRNVADPFVLAEARIRSVAVVTYEGRGFDGARTKNWAKRMPGICQRLGIPCCTLPEALQSLGFRLDR